MTLTNRYERNLDEYEKGLIEAKSVASFKTKLFKEFLTFRDAYELLMINASNQEKVDTWLEKLSELEDKAKGVKIKISKTRSRNKEFFDFRRARKLFFNHMISDFNMRINSINDIGRMAVYNDDNLLYQPFYDFNPNSLIYPFINQKEGILASVSGVMGSGKTDFALFLAELLMQYEDVKFCILTNIPIEETDRINVRRSMSELLIRLIQLSKIESMHTVVIMDETSQFFSRREPGKKSNIMLEKFLRLIRKFNASIIFIDQLKDGLPGAAIAMRTAIYHKTGLKKLHYSTYLGKRQYNNFLSSIPPTKLKFDTKHMGGFIYDISMETLFDEVLLEDDQGTGLLKVIQRRMKSKDLTTVDRIKQFVKNNPGVNQKDVANFIGISEAAISKHISNLVSNREINRKMDGKNIRLFPLN